MLDFIFSTLIILLGFVFINSNSKNTSSEDRKNLNLLWVYHLFFSVLYYIYTRSNSADSNGYWRTAKNATENDLSYFFSQGFGTNFMYIINYYPAKILNLSIFSGTILYSLLSLIGFYYIYITIKTIVPYNSKLFKFNLFPLLLFLPNLHFWTVGTGKDTIMFFSIAAFSYSILNIKKNKFLLIISSLLMLLVRPHIFLVLIISIVYALLFLLKTKAKYKFILLIITSGIILLILPTVLAYVNLVDINDVQSILTRAKTQSNNLRGSAVGSSVDTSSYSFPLKILSFLYRPLFIDYNGLFSLISSFENLILLILTFMTFKNNFFKAIKSSPVIIKILLVYFILGTIMFSVSLSNLGIYLRMKNMLIPSLIIIVLWVLSFNKIKNNEIR